MTVGPVVEGVAALLLAHREVTDAPHEHLLCPHRPEKAWRLPDDLFLVGLLGAACGDRARLRQVKRSCFEAFRRNEADAASFLQSWWRGIMVRRLQAQPVPRAIAQPGVPQVAALGPHKTDRAPCRGSSEQDLSPCSLPLLTDFDSASLVASSPMAQGADGRQDHAFSPVPFSPSAPSAPSRASPANSAASKPPSQPGTPRSIAMAALAGALGRRAQAAPPLPPATPTSKPPSAPSTPRAAAAVFAAGTAQVAVAAGSPQNAHMAPEPVACGRAADFPTSASLETSQAVSKSHEAPSRSVGCSKQAKARPVRPPPIRTGESPERKAASPASAVSPGAAQLQTGHIVSEVGAVLQSCGSVEVSELESRPPLGEGTPLAAGSAGELALDPHQLPPGQCSPAVQSRGAHMQPPGKYTQVEADLAGEPAGGYQQLSCGQMALPVADSAETPAHEYHHVHPAQCTRSAAAPVTHRSERASPRESRQLPSTQGRVIPSGARPTQGISSPAGMPAAGIEDNRCKGIRGDNPYRRKWNPRLAAAHRRELECAKRQQQEELGQAEALSTRPTLADYLNVEAEQAADAEAFAAVAEAAQLEAEASALAEIAAAANLADQRVARQQDSVVLAARQQQSSRPRYGEPPAAPAAESAESDEAALMDYGSARSGFSLSAPKDRGPEHRPGSREVRESSTRCRPERDEMQHEESLPSDDFCPAPMRSMPAPLSQPATLWPGSLHEAPQSRPVAASGGYSARDRDLLKSSSPILQRTYSFDGSNASLDPADAEAALTFIEPDSPIAHPQRAAPPAAKPHAREDTGSVEAPRRAMAEIRAAAERRAYRRVEEDPVEAELPEDLQGAISVAAESRKSMSAIRAIAERRAGGIRGGGTTPRGGNTPRDLTALTPTRAAADEMQEVTPMARAPLSARGTKESEPLKCGGAYRPTHVYSGRSGSGGSGLAETLGLRFGQPPPGR